jgi:flagellar export protein FliJ
MADTLDVLIQVAERKVEAMQRDLAATREQLVILANEMKRLEQEAAVAFVTAVAEDDVLALQAAGAFQERMRREVSALKELEVMGQQKEVEQRQALQALYAVQKKYELLLEKQKLAKRKERLKKAQNQLDEVAGRKL